MLTRTPADDERPEPTPRTGHGAASLIPHLHHEAHDTVQQGESGPGDPSGDREAPQETAEPVGGRSIFP